MTAVLVLRPLQRTSCVPRILEGPPATQRKTRCSSWKLPSASSSPLKLYISGGTGSRERGSWESLEGFVVVTAPQSADIILGYSEETAIVPGQLVARLDGDVCLVSKIDLCRLARGQSWFPPTVDIRQEVAELLCEENCVVHSWYVLLPGERGSPIQPRVARNKVELVRWAEVGPCVASQCEYNLLLELFSCYTLYYSTLLPWQHLRMYKGLLLLQFTL